MNTKTLTKLYDRLTARERLPLLIAAGARGDDVERERLLATAPWVTFSAPHHYRLADALYKAADWHRLILLDLAANFWQWWGLWMIHGVQANRPTGGGRPRRGRRYAALAHEMRAYSLARYHAARFVNHVDGWQRFCAELHIDPLAQLEPMIGWQTVVSTESPARELAFSVEEAALFVASATVPGEGPDEPDRGPLAVDSPEALAKGWHALLDDMVQHRGG